MGLDKPKWEVEQINENPEHDLFNSVVTEFNDIAGFSILYYPLDHDNSGGDYLFGEYKELAFFGPYETKITYDPVEDEMLGTQFGIFMEETLDLALIPKSTFTRDVASNLNDTSRLPMVGDIIITRWNGKKYEVTDVDDDARMFMGSMLVWNLTLKPLRYSEDSKTMDNIMNTDPFDLGDIKKDLDEFGDNDNIETDSDDIDSYTDVDESIYGR